MSAMVTSKSFNNIFNIFTEAVSIDIIAKFDNLSWPMVFLKYVFSRLSELKDLSLLQDVAGITLNVFNTLLSSGINPSVLFS